MKKITVSSNKKELTTILDFINQNLSSFNYSAKFLMELELSVEEIFTNIVDYAFISNFKKNKIVIKYSIENNFSSENDLNSKNSLNLENHHASEKNPLKVVIKFIDEGIPYNPLNNEIPDISLSSDERDIGGLGILLIKKNVDQIDYEYKDKKNILTIKKRIK